MNNYLKNIKLYIPYNVLFNTLMIWSINIPFLKFKGLSFFEIMLFYSLISVLGIIFEIPAGVFSDRRGYKLSLLISSFCKLFALTFMLLIDNVIFRALSILLFALSDAFFSGTDMAILHKSLEKSDMTEEFGTIVRKSRKWSLLCLAIATLASGVVYDLHPYLPFILSAFSVAGSLIISLLLYDEHSVENKALHKNEYKKIYRSISQNVAASYRIIIVYVIFTYIFSNMNFIAQEVMDTKNIPYEYFGLIFFISNMISVLVFKYGDAIERKVKKRLFSISATTFVLIFAALILTRDSTAAILLLPLMRIASAMSIPQLDIALNNSINVNERATFLSVSSALCRVVQLLADPLIGLIIDNKGIYFAISIFCGISFVVLVLINRYSAHIVPLME